MLAYHGESLSLLYRRWHKLRKHLQCDENVAWDVTKIPDIFDSAVYDMLHNADLLPDFRSYLAPVLQVSRILSDFVIPQEYGTTVDEKRQIASLLGKPLFDRIVQDCTSIVNQVDDKNSVFYFLNESHMHVLRNSFIWSGFADNQIVADNLELMPLAYCSHMLLKLYGLEVNGHTDYSVAIQFSPGAVEYPDIVRHHHVQQVSVPAPFCSCVPFETFCNHLRAVATE